MARATDQVTDIIRRQFRTRAFTYVTSFEELGADSVDMVDLAVTLEDAFGIAIADDDLLECVTVGSAIALVNRLLEVPGAGLLAGPGIPNFDLTTTSGGPL